RLVRTADLHGDSRSAQRLHRLDPGGRRVLRECRRGRIRQHHGQESPPECQTEARTGMCCVSGGLPALCQSLVHGGAPAKMFQGDCNSPCSDSLSFRVWPSERLTTNGSPLSWARLIRYAPGHREIGGPLTVPRATSDLPAASWITK